MQIYPFIASKLYHSITLKLYIYIQMNYKFSVNLYETEKFRLVSNIDIWLSITLHFTTYYSYSIFQVLIMYSQKNSEL